MTAAIALALLALVGGCSSPRSTHDYSNDGDSTDKYTQTWGKSYSSTTCAEWRSEMSSAQQWAASADMLAGARNKGDGGTGLPQDSLITEFQSGITTACVIDSQDIAGIGAALYLTERSRFRP
jgi:hypothetical protein